MTIQKITTAAFLAVAIQSQGCSAPEFGEQASGFGTAVRSPGFDFAVPAQVERPPLNLTPRYPSSPADAGTGMTPVDAGMETPPDAGQSTMPDAGSAGGSSVLGWNLDFVYAGGFGFANKIKMSRRWISCTAGTWDDGRTIATDANGWPTSLQSGQHAATLMTLHGGGHYVITWTGSGTVEVSDHLGVVSQQPNRIVVDTAVNDLFQVRITSVPVRDIEVRKEGQPANLVWDPVFEQRLAGAKVLRYMQWGMLNGDSGGVATNWSDRSKPDYFTQNQRYGVAYEHMIALSNHLGADAWINVPHLANDNYVQSLATLLRDTLDPSLKIYVEWSNEVWNDSFPQAAWARQQGTAAGLGNGDSHLARLQFQSRRTRQVFQIFESVFAGQMHRLVRVVASQMGNGWNDNQLMSFEGLASHADALAVAPYFGHSAGKQRNAQNVRSGGVTWVLDHLEYDALPGLIEEMDVSAASAAQWNVPLIAYEGGQHVVAEPAIHNDTTVTSVLEEAQRHPRMYDLYREMLAAWDAAGGGLFVHYTITGAWGKWGYWGALENNDSAVNGSGAHKYRAMLDWSATHP
jgi:hypothetical protein